MKISNETDSISILVIGVIFCVISIIGCLFNIIAFKILNANRIYTKLVLYLAISDLVFSLFNTIFLFLLIFRVPSFNWYCYLATILINASGISTWIWTSAITLYMFRSSVGNPFVLHFFGWIVPILVQVTSFLVDYFGGHKIDSYA